MTQDVYLTDRPLGEALESYLELLEEAGALAAGSPETIPVEDSAGRVTSGPVHAMCSSPAYHASAMDGIAVCCGDTFGASESTPINIFLGERARVVDTGDPLPPGLDAVIMIEDVHFTGEDAFEITAAAAPWQHVRAMGEDIVATEMILPSNHLIRPVDIGGLLAGNVIEIPVHPVPRVAVLPTGTELVEPGSHLKPGDIIEYNSRVFSAMVREWGGRAFKYGIIPDNYELLRGSVQRAVKEADIVIINAGSSAGREDFTASVIADLGAVHTHGVAIKPGKPVILGLVRGKPVLGIPGYPVSGVLAMDLFVRPLVYRKQGLPLPDHQAAGAAVSRKVVSQLGVEEFVRVKLGQVGDKIVATPMARGAGLMMSLVRADGILRVPKNSEGYNAGDRVQVELMRGLSEVRDTTVVIGSHDMALDVLADYLKTMHPGASLSSAHVGSLGGLAALRRGEAHCAGTHLLDESNGEYNVPYIKRLLSGTGVVLVNLAYREQGLMVARGNPKGIAGIQDLARPEVAFANRQRGAGTRVLFDMQLQRCGIEPGQINGYSREEFTHMAVAAAVAGGSADAGMGIGAAARALGLDFVGVAEERYDLCIPAGYMDTPHIARVMEVLQSRDFKDAVLRLGGYDLRDCGRVMWESR